MIRSAPRVALLYQALDSPVINRVSKPKKPTGYKDSCADIAHVLAHSTPPIPVVTPVPRPSTAVDADWSFADTEAGILAAITAGANTLWANTVVFSSHPLQCSPLLQRYADSVRVVGHPPLLVEAYDDKNFVNQALRARRDITMPKGTTVCPGDDVNAKLESAGMTSSLPVVGKPVRGRGSHGVKVCRTPTELKAHIDALFNESGEVMLEEFLAGQEGTVTVMPPSPDRPNYWALPVVLRTNHIDDVLPYNGLVPVTANSRVVTPEEAAADPAFEMAMKECEKVAGLIGGFAPIRIDIRRRDSVEGSRFVLFDVNMKPSVTGPGRPGREDQASLSALAAEGLGWDYGMLMKRMLNSARPLSELRSAKPTLGG